MFASGTPRGFPWTFVCIMIRRVRRGLLGVLFVAACGNTTSSLSYTEAEVSEICDEYCAADGCYRAPFEVTDEERAECYAACTQGCRHTTDCDYAGACVNELISARACEASCQCDLAGDCGRYLVRQTACERRQVYGESFCEAAEACDVAKADCLLAFDIEQDCSFEWSLYLECVAVKRNLGHPDNLCGQVFNACTGNPCADCEDRRRNWELCVEVTPFRRSQADPPPACAR